ncbi:Ras-related protein RABF1 [Tritrichomonas foetus]|uniref:Ras-related protein RABF1 n=1 Tax=Tritrichomonas foetus TaxID=1144522 RepID=A0A1J4KXA3_9EUKA|nr:Ras-related protein RABF1 [Tritrichomonas foetus]|eukprot:OHT15883.1 Ras-related protein RABF1 [Tritrichomonas foetus]
MSQTKVAKTVIVGDAGVGKTCLAKRAFTKNFDPHTEPTMGSEFFEGTRKMKDGTTLKFEIWDTAGQEVYRALAPVFFKNATIAILVFDVTKPKTLEALDYYVDALNTHTPNCFIAIVGNKIDLENDRQVTFQQGNDYAEKIKSTFYVETSATRGDNVDQLFNMLAQVDSLKFAETAPGVVSDIGNKEDSSKKCC